MADKIMDEERARIVAYLKEDKSQCWIAKEVGRDKSTVSRIAKAEGIDTNVAATKKATKARQDYDQAARLELLNEGFDRAREILASLDGARDLQAWMIAVATGIDKRRLEDGEATSRTESMDPERAEARRKMRESLDEIAAQRRKNVA